MKAQFPIVTFLIFSSSIILADRITIHNKTPRDLYCALYYLDIKLPWEKKQPIARIASSILFCESESSCILERPSRRFLYPPFDPKHRELVFVEDKDVLVPELSKLELEKHHSKNVGDMQGDVFYIGDKDGELYGYTTVEWNVAKSTLQLARAKILTGLAGTVDNPYKNTVAHVRKGNELSQGEKEYLKQRTPKVKMSFEKLIGAPMANAYVPKVAIVCSGGGYRSMLYCTGALLGAQRTGILDVATYMVGLSGGSWAIGGWVLSDQSIGAYHDWLINNVKFGLGNISASDAKLISDFLITKYFSDEPLDIVDLYGCLLANELFAKDGPRKQQQTLSSQAARIAQAKIPYPIYAAIAAENSAAENLWYEFTPHEIGAPWLSMYVPSWAFGRKFKNGASVNFASEQNFGVLLGTYGLAIGITIKRLILEIALREKVPTIFAKNIVDRIIEEQGHKRITSSDFLNFSYQMAGSPLQASPRLKMVDAGINFNLPYPSISGERPDRKADIIIFVEASSDFSNELRKVEQYARAKNIKFPTIDYNNLGKKAVSVFSGDAQTPIVIYLPRIVDQELFKNPQYASLAKEFGHLTTFDVERCLQSGPCATFNFKYTPEQARMLAHLGTFNMMVAKNEFVKAVKLKIQQMAPSAAAYFQSENL